MTVCGGAVGEDGCTLCGAFAPAGDACMRPLEPSAADYEKAQRQIDAWRQAAPGGRFVSTVPRYGQVCMLAVEGREIRARAIRPTSAAATVALAEAL